MPDKRGLPTPSDFSQNFRRMSPRAGAKGKKLVVQRSKPPPTSGLAGNHAPARMGWEEKPHDQKVTVIIPVLNESARVGSVVKLALRSPRVGEVIVVDDGSIDDTPKLAQAAGARV